MDVNDIKIVFLGQDCYHGPNQAMGLSFSVNNDVKIPPSLANIYKELKNTYPERNYVFEQGNLEKWFTREKIFLLNSSLSVKECNPGSHMKIWENFTNKVIEFISDNNENCVFLLLGNFAKSKSKFIKNKNNIIEGIHPSPLAHGFIGSNIFKKVEEVIGYEINWSN
jgi:uracil-DNA glycosylase